MPDSSLSQRIDIFPWDDNFNTGLPRIDAQHRELVAILNRLASQVAFGTHSCHLATIFDQLIDYTHYHFDSEEAIWSEHLPDGESADDHRRNHQRFIARLHALKARQQQCNDEHMIDEVLDFLVRWLATHILEADRELAETVLGMQRGMDLTQARAWARERLSGANRRMIDIILSIYATLTRNTLRLMRELSQQRPLNQQLRLQALVLDQILDHVTVTDLDGNILYINDAEVRDIGYTKADLVGRHVSCYGDDAQAQAHQEEIVRHTREHGSWRGEVVNVGRDGQRILMDLRTCLVRDEDGEPVAMVGVGTDISERKAAERQIEFMAYNDLLTGLPNRQLFADRLRQAISLSRRSSRLLAIGYLDLDGFKPINDRHGHVAGDQLLIQIADRLKQQLREGDTLARLGGDEFVVLLNSLGNIYQGEEIVQRLLECIAEPFEMQGERLHLSASIGVTFFPQDDADPDTLLRHADQAMFLAKESGKNTYRLYDPVQDQKVHAHRQFLAAFEQALRQDQLVLHFQPRIDLRSAALVSVEALVRWQHPQRGLLAPGEFLPIIADSPLEIALDEWVIRAALDQHLRWCAQGLVLQVSVNLSPRHIQQASFPDYLERLLADYPAGIAQYLEFEVLETGAIGDTARVAEIMRACTALGVHFSLDDFGTGYSSLTHFHRLPIGIVKVDQRFVRDMLSDAMDQDIVEGVVRLAEALKRPVVAEGVETIEVGLMLSQLGCHYAQGYGIARPMAADALPGWAHDWRGEALWSSLARIQGPTPHYDLNVAIFTHRRWLQDLTRCLQAGRVASFTELDVASCRFAHWYQGIGASRYGHHCRYRAIEARHRALHQQAEALVALAERDGVESALVRLDELEQSIEGLAEVLRELAG